MSLNSADLTVVRQFQSEADAIREAPRPRWAQVTVLLLAALLVSGVVIMCFTEVDRVVTSVNGRIVATQFVNVHQALEPAIIRSIDVREGQRVKAGQLLATLDPTFAAADVKQLHQQIASLTMQIARLDAELAKRPLELPAAEDEDFFRYAAMQKALYDQRNAQYKAQLNSFDAKIQQVQATIKKLEGDEGRYQQREDIAKSIEDMRTGLAERGSGSRLNMLLSQDARLEMLRSLEQTHNSLIEARHMLSALTADRDAYAQQWATQLSQDLVTARNNLDTASAQFEKATKRQDLVRLTAAEDSIVLTVAKLSVGSVLTPGAPFITLMPSNSPVEAEVEVASRDVGFLRAGDRCVLKVDAFKFVAHGTAEGTVRWISAGAFTLDNDGKPVDPYYKVRCGVDATHFTGVPENFQLLPGMTLTANAKVGRRSVAYYMLDGLLRGYHEAMREP